MTIVTATRKNNDLKNIDSGILFVALGRYQALARGFVLSLMPLLLGGAMWRGSTVLHSQIVSHEAKTNTPPCVTLKITQRYIIVFPNSSGSIDPAGPNGLEKVLKRPEKDSESRLKRNPPRDLKKILTNHYKGSSFIWQERAFRRVLRWRDDLEDIAKDYSNVDWKRLSAVIKAETQGRTGEQVSRAKAIGMAQIKYQGAWAFLWDAMFSEKTNRGSPAIKDYYNTNIRARYRSQLKQIKQYLNDNNILIHPSNSSQDAYKKARYASWSNLKTYLKTEFKPGDYQVAVDIAAMYIDHLTLTFHQIRQQVEGIKQSVEKNGKESFGDLTFSGTKQTRWNRIRGYLRKDFECMDIARAHELTLSHLNTMLVKLEDPHIYSAAYNLGIRKVLRYVESGRRMPERVENYVEQVSMYTEIFHEIEQIGAYS
jgi:hypothetical protein